MNKKTFGIFLSLLSVVIVTVPLSTVFATKPTPVNTVLQMMGPPTYEKQTFAGNNKIVRGTASIMWGWTVTGMVGDIQGLASCEFVWNFHPDHTQVTGISVHTIESALVIVDGVPLTGSLTIGISINKGMEGTWRIIRGTEALSNLHGTGTWELILATPNNPYDYAYSGNVHLDP